MVVVEVNDQGWVIEVGCLDLRREESGSLFEVVVCGGWGRKCQRLWRWG